MATKNKRDYYEILAVTRAGVRRGDQALVPQARGQVSPGQKPGRPDRGRTIQGARRSLRRPDGCEQARRLRSLWACRLRPGHRRSRGRAGSTIRSIFFAKSSAVAVAEAAAESSRRFSAAARRWIAKVASAAPTALRHADHARGSGLRRGEGDRGPQARHLREVRRQRRRARLALDQLPDLRRPRPGDQLARILSGFADVPALPRRRPDHRETVPRLRWRRARRETRAASS